jgi:hypothetical protein
MWWSPLKDRHQVFQIVAGKGNWTAWFLLHRLREGCGKGDDAKNSFVIGIVEADAAYLGGLKRIKIT